MKRLILVLTLFGFGCASVRHGAPSKSLTAEGEQLAISVDPLTDYSDDTNIYLDFSIENQGSRWLKIDQVAIDFPTPENTVHNVIVGDDLKVWAESMENKKRLERYNTQLGPAILAIGGIMVALLGVKEGNSGLASVGLATSTAGLAWDAQHRVKTNREHAQNSFSVPETYLLAPFTVPSQGLIRRWALVNVPERKIAKKALLTLTTVEGVKMRYEVPIVFKK